MREFTGSFVPHSSGFCDVNCTAIRPIRKPPAANSTPAIRFRLAKITHPRLCNELYEFGCKWKKRSETQTLRAGRSNAKPNIFSPDAEPFPGVQEGQNFISWIWSLPLPTDPVWWKSMHAISSYRSNRHRPPARCKHTNTQTGPITIHCAAKLSAQCINSVGQSYLLL